MIKTRTWIWLIAALAILLAALSAWLLFFRTGHTVQVVQNGVVIREINLDRVTEEEIFTVPAPDGGSNTVTVQPGRICVSAADCPDQICVQRGWLTEGAPIVCMPHRLVIQTVGASNADAVSQ